VTETPTSYFVERWASSPDPWEHATRWYEARKYDLTVACLPRRRYAFAAEAACGAGVLTARLATRADVVLASDRFEGAVRATAARCADLAGVRTEVRDVRDGPPAGNPDLVVLGECLYYFDLPTIVDVLRAWRLGAAVDAHVVLVHYRRAVPEHVVDGDAVHAVAVDLLGRPLVHHVEDDFLLDVFEVAP
jgi:hypothetical protein